MEVRFAAILALFLWGACIAGASAQDRTASERYANAVMKARGITPHTINAIEQAVVRGWPAGTAAGELRVLLRSNAPALAEVRRGAALASCVFYPGVNAFERSTDDFVVLCGLVRLCGVHARFVLLKGDETSALRDIEAMFGTGRQMTYDRTASVKFAGLRLVHQACSLARGLRGPPAMAALGEYLKGYELAPLADIPAAEKGVFVDGVELASREAGALRARILGAAPLVADRYYDPVITAFGSGSDWTAVREMVDALRSRLAAKYGEINVEKLIERADGADEDLAEDACGMVLCKVWPDFALGKKLYKKTQRVLEALRKKLTR